jgi:hypothetical protein
LPKKGFLVSKKKKEFTTDLLRQIHETDVVLVQGSGISTRPTDLKTLPEDERFRVCEEMIEQGLKAYFEIGRALAEIQESRLYRQTYDTFEDYCAERWNIARRTAYQLIEAYRVVENVRNCAQVPATESQARELAKLPPELQEATWQAVLDEASGGNITAKKIAEKVAARIKELGLVRAVRAITDAPTAEEMALAHLRRAVGRNPGGLKVVISGEWLLQQHLTAYWRTLRPDTPEQVDETFRDELTWPEAKALGLL